MSLNEKNPFFANSSIIGSALAVLVSVPLTAYLGSFAETYNERVALYGGLLLWVICGAFAIAYVTKDKNTALSFRLLLLWFISTWLWPIPLLMALRRKNSA